LSFGINNGLHQGWESTTIGEVILPYETAQPNKEPNKEYQYIDIGSIDNTNHTITNPKTFLGKDAPSRARRIVKKGDVLFSTVRTYLKNIACVPAELDGVLTSTGIAVLRTASEIDSNFLFYFVLSEQFIREISRAMDGTLYPAVSDGDVAAAQIAIPPLNEQRRIVAKIEALKARSQRVKEELEAIPALLDQFRQSVLAAAFRGDLTADWREKNPDVEPASVLLERIRAERRRRWEEAELEKMKAQGKTPKDDQWKKKYKEPESVDDSQLPKLPDGWCWVTADECTSLITDGEHATPERSDEGVYLLSARNILDGKISFEKVDFVPEHIYQKLEKRLKLEAGNVLLSCSGTVGRSCVAPLGLRCAFVRSVAILKPLFEMGEYLSLAIRSPYLQSQIEQKKTQTAQSNIFQGRIKILAIPVAPFDEQKVIVQAITQAFKLIERVEKIIEDARNNNITLDQSILAKAFRGELVPQDPNDEPASVLLERIRAEREKLDTKKKAKGKTEKKSRKEKLEAPEPEQLSFPGFE
jgi:type I restriction enzyme S subunit